MKIIIIGLGAIGTTVLQSLTGEGHTVTIIDEDKEKIETLIEKYDVTGIVGNGACMDIQMAEDIADLLLQDKEEVRKLGKDAILKREYALEDVAIVIDHNERLKNRSFISGSIKGFELVEDW